MLNLLMRIPLLRAFIALLPETLETAIIIFCQEVRIMFRTVGKRQVPEHLIYPLNTPEQREEYFCRLQRMEENPLRSVARVMLPDEPRVKHFRTLEAANADQIEGMVRTMNYLHKSRTYL